MRFDLRNRLFGPAPEAASPDPRNHHSPRESAFHHAVESLIKHCELHQRPDTARTAPHSQRASSLAARAGFLIMMNIRNASFDELRGFADPERVRSDAADPPSAEEHARIVSFRKLLNGIATAARHAPEGLAFGPGKVLARDARGHAIAVEHLADPRHFFDGRSRPYIEARHLVAIQNGLCETVKEIFGLHARRSAGAPAEGDAPSSTPLPAQQDKNRNRFFRRLFGREQSFSFGPTLKTDAQSIQRRESEARHRLMQTAGALMLDMQTVGDLHKAVRDNGRLSDYAASRPLTDTCNAMGLLAGLSGIDFQNLPTHNGARNALLEAIDRKRQRAANANNPRLASEIRQLQAIEILTRPIPVLSGRRRDGVLTAAALWTLDDRHGAPYANPAARLPRETRYALDAALQDARWLLQIPGDVQKFDAGSRNDAPPVLPDIRLSATDLSLDAGQWLAEVDARLNRKDAAG